MHAGNRSRAADELGISRCYLHRLLNQLKMADNEAAEEHQVEQMPEIEQEIRSVAPTMQIA
jgi:hypothetical protein